MFGQATSPFASPSGTTTPFGGGGGQAGQSTFGAPSGFGAQPAAAPTTGFGAFGSQGREQNVMASTCVLMTWLIQRRVGRSCRSVLSVYC